MRLSAISLLVLLGSEESFGGFERRYVGPRSLATAGALCAFGEDAWSYYYNPAHSTQIGEIGSFYTPYVLGLQEVRAEGISFRSNMFGFDFGAAVHTFGFELYRENVFTLNLSTPIYGFLFAGSNINLNQLYVKDYGTDASVSIDAGVRMLLSSSYSVAFSVANLNSASMTLSKDRLPQTFTAAAAYRSEGFNMGVEYYKEIGFPSAIRIAAEYSPVSFVTFRAGSASGTNSFNAGVAFRFLSIHLDYGASFHQVLGITHSFGLSFVFRDMETGED
ncbi:MAG: hypothetical protein M1469_03020 [Bacteroidetes bacterium]|nr:hypothetical protein [Bacteroidota bacterium]